ncbi:MAG: TIGR02281 family clan AA aspartic protease [Hyphomicrobiales bacterium]
MTFHLSRRTLLAGSLATAAMLPGVQPARAVIYEVKAGDNGHFWVTASIEDTDVKAVIDTGASQVVLSYEDADRINLHLRDSDFSVPVSTANGMAKAAAVSLRRVDIGNIRVRDVEALVAPKGALTVTLIGMSFLSKLKGYKVSDGTLVLDN